MSRRKIKGKRENWIFRGGPGTNAGEFPPGICNRCVFRNVGLNCAAINCRKVSIFGLIICHLLSVLTTIFAAKDIPTYHLTAVQGDPVYMPCNISTSEEGDAVVIVLWYREDLGTPIYTVDTRDRSIHQADRWSADTVFANRAYFMPDKIPAELGIDHVRESDAGVYRCRVDFRKAQTRNTKVNLSVIVPPHRLVITDETGIERTSIVGPYSEASNLRLKCDVYGGKPKPTVTWWRGKENVGKITFSSGSQIQSEVFLTNLQREDLNTELTCTAINDNSSSPLSSTVYVDMNFPPLNVNILGSTQILSAGKRYDLLCQSSGSRPPAILTWWRDDEQLEKTKETVSSDGNTTTSTLSFVPSKNDAGKYLSCRSANPVLNGDSLESKWKLEIQYAPECTVSLGKSLNKNAIKEGSDIYFDCLVNAEPPVYKVKWKHNNRELHHNIGQGIIISNQSLVLQGVSRSSAGNYSCVGYNSEGESESEPFLLNILYAPTCKPNQLRVHGIAKSEKASVSCSVEANPADVSFRWLFNNSAESIDVASSHITKSGTVSVVSYTPRTEMDYGTLLCWARNSIGDQKVPCVFHIIAAGRPDPVMNCTVSNLTTSSFAVKCTEGFNGGLPQSFFLEVLQITTQGVKKNTTSPFPRFVVDQLEPGVQYHVFVYAFNTKGRSEPIVLQASTLQIPERQLVLEKEKRKSVIEMIPMTTIAATIGGAIFLMAVAIALVLRIKCNRETRKKLLKGESELVCTTVRKTEQNVCGPGEGDEKNPDVIPQPNSAEDDDRISYTIRRQRISTIETSSPTRGLISTSLYASGPQGYCTIRKGVHLSDVSHFQHSIVEEMSFATGNRTLPRNPWKETPCVGQQKILDVRPGLTALNPIKLGQIPSVDDDASDASFVISKIESTV